MPSCVLVKEGLNLSWKNKKDKSDETLLQSKLHYTDPFVLQLI